MAHLDLIYLLSITCYLHIRGRSRNFDCLVTWFCYQLIAKPGNKTSAVPWRDPYIYKINTWSIDKFSFIFMQVGEPNISEQSRNVYIVAR